MISALLYLQLHSLKNRLVRQFKRLKQPKYLVFAIVGGLYFYFYFFRFLFQRRGGASGWSNLSPETLAFYESIGAGIFLIIILLAWIIPHERAALAFTEAEVAFLFPAPISRRGLIHFKLLRSQAAILFTTLFLTLFSNRLGGSPWIRAASWWLILSTMNLHFIGSSFARTMLLDRGITNWQRRIGILTLILALGGAVFVWARQTIPTLDPARLNDLAAVREYAQQILASGPLPWLLYPFRLVVRPYLAPDAHAFLAVLGPAVLILLAHYVWVVRSNVAFEEASVEASRKVAEKLAAIRSGNWQTAGKKPRVKRAPFALAPTGFPTIALLWKNLIQAGQAFSSRIWIVLVAIAIGSSVALRESAARSGFLPAIGILAAILVAWSLLFGPHILRQDLRRDLQQMDVLKLFPMPGWQVVLGELLAPAVILCGIQWCLLIIAVGFFPQMQSNASWGLIAGCGFGAAIVVPLLDLILLLIPNAAVLLFPAWFQTGADSRGIEATGQRLVFMLGQLIVFALSLIPAFVAFAVVFFPIKMAVGLAAAVPLGAVAAALVLGVEVTLGVLLLGRFFEKFDLSAELPV